MRLEIEDSTNLLLNKSFGSWLIDEIQRVVKNSINESKLRPWDKFIKEEYEHLYSKKITGYDTIMYGLDNLVCDLVSNKLVIKISTNQFIPGLHRVRVDTLCRLINYGNTSIKGYPIFTDAFNIIADNIDILAKEYLEGNLIDGSDIL